VGEVTNIVGEVTNIARDVAQDPSILDELPPEALKERYCG